MKVPEYKHIIILHYFGHATAVLTSRETKRAYKLQLITIRTRVTIYIKYIDEEHIFFFVYIYF